MGFMYKIYTYEFSLEKMLKNKVKCTYDEKYCKRYTIKATNI